VGQALVPTTTGDVIVANGGSSPVVVRLATSGYLTADPTPGGATLTTLAGPWKVVESARSIGITPMTTAAARIFTVTGTAVPSGARAVLVSVSATGGPRDGLLTIGPVGSVRPIQVLSLTARTTASDTALVPVGPDGRLSIATSSVGAAVRVLVVGYAA
jgi:hypothetical protein